MSIKLIIQVPGLNSADLSKMIKDNSKVPDDVQITEVAS